MSEHIERSIVIGLIVSDDFARRIRNRWDDRYLKSNTARQIAGWCLEYFDKYEKVPYRDIEAIYYDKLDSGKLSKDLAEEIEEEILPSLDEEYEDHPFNSNYLYDKTVNYFRARDLELHNEEIADLLNEGETEEAETKASTYKPKSIVSVGLDLSSPEALDAIKNAFTHTAQQVLSYPGALGDFWNDQMIRGGFIGVMAVEKRGKTHWLMELAMRGILCKANVAFFQAGDMTEAQQLRRLCIYLAKKSDKEKYCGTIMLPIRDCLLSQMNRCDNPDREDVSGPLETLWKLEDQNKPWQLREKITADILTEALEKDPDYIPCRNCPKWKTHGSIWYKPYETGAPLEVLGAQKVSQAFFTKNKRKFMLSSHVNGTLSIQEIKRVLSGWEYDTGFVPDLILVDYADLLVPDYQGTEFRHQQNAIWKGLRGLSQEKHCLVVTATQADAAAYEQDSLRLKNFSEDKRKYAHVTAMYGLNQDKSGREKKLGLMRINQLVIREGDFSVMNQVYVMQRLEIGRPYLGSFK